MAEPVPPGGWEGYERGSAGYRRVLLALLCAGVATFAQLYSVQGVLPLMAADLGLDAAQASLGVSAATLGLAVAVLPWSVVSDRWGRLRTMVVAVAAATVLGLAMPLAPGFEAVVVLRFVEGAALGGIPAVAMAYLAEEVDSRHSAVAAGTYVAGTSLGGLAGRIVAAPVGDALGWRTGTITVSVLAALAAVGFVLLAPRQRGFVRQSVRLTGPGGLLGRLRANLADAGLVVLYLQGFLLMGGFVAIYNYLGFHLGEEPFGVSQTVVSLLFLAYLSGTWSSGTAGRAAAARGRRVVLAGSGTLMLAGLLGTLVPSIPVVVAGLLLFTAGFFAAHAVASGWVPVRSRTGTAQASSLYTLFYYAGSSVLGSAGGVFYTRSGWGGAVGFVAALVVAAVVLALVVLREPRPAS
ncbi:MFS transporter [Kocuria rosea]|uniref:MFS transporter n=1 Tax=Kocuria rosea TaxID=1275 RepID=UPI00203A56A4|nr:MFS transporter [Kocuria rosea]MCM3688083.1 MFS transporter [Kocuria rosea]